MNRERSSNSRPFYLRNEYFFVIIFLIIFIYLTEALRAIIDQGGLYREKGYSEIRGKGWYLIDSEHKLSQ